MKKGFCCSRQSVSVKEIRAVLKILYCRCPGILISSYVNHHWSQTKWTQPVQVCFWLSGPTRCSNFWMRSEEYGDDTIHPSKGASDIRGYRWAMAPISSNRCRMVGRKRYSKMSQFWREESEVVGQPSVSTTDWSSAFFHTQHTPGFRQMLSNPLLTVVVLYYPFQSQNGTWSLFWA